MSHLIPTPIVDRNGKVTTVRRKPATAASGRKSAIPSPVSPAPTTESKLLKLPSYSKSEIDSWQQKMRDERNWVTSAIVDRLEPATQSLIKRYVDEKVMTEAYAKRLLSTFDPARQMTRQPAIEHNLTLVAAQLIKQTGDEKKLYPGFVRSSMLGAFYSTTPSKRRTHIKIETESELERIVALTHVLRSLDTDPFDSYIAPSQPKLPNGEKVLVHKMKDRKLAEVIQDNPKDADRIIEFIKTRGVQGEGGIAALKDFLKDDSPTAIDDGWL